MKFMIRKQLKSRMKELKITGKEMAARINRSQSALSSYFSGKDELDFYNLSLLVKELYPDQSERFDVAKNVLLSLERPDNIKCAIEGASFREDIEVLEKLLINAENHQNRELHEWAKVYSVHSKYLKKEISAIEMVNLARQLNIKKEEESNKKENKNEELLFFQKWMETYGYYINKTYSVLPVMLNELGVMLSNISNEYIKNNYSTKFYLLTANFNLFDNNVVKAEKYYNKVIDNSTSLQKIGHAYHGLGVCNMFKDKELSYKYFMEALKIFTDLKENTFVENVKHAFNLTSNFHSDEKFYTYEDCIGLRLETAHRYIKMQELNKAKEIMNLINFEELSVFNKAFYSLYKGMLHDDIDSLYMSIMYFKEVNSKFYALLPCKELIKRNERESAVCAAYGEIIDFS